LTALIDICELAVLFVTSITAYSNGLIFRLLICIYSFVLFRLNSGGMQPAVQLRHSVNYQYILQHVSRHGRRRNDHRYFALPKVRVHTF